MAILPRPSRTLGVRLAMVAILNLLVAIAGPGTAVAESGHVRLALLPIGQPGAYFDLSMQPGESRTFDIEIANHGDVAIVARTYAADAYTIINGGFGGRLRDQPQTGTTKWLDYPTDVLQLPAGRIIRRSFTVTVPPDARPGEYITSILLENDDPFLAGESVTLDQIVRQAVAVVVTVPGKRSSGLAVGAATHGVVAGRSTVSIAVENTGNVRLRPHYEFTLLDANGVAVSHATGQMDTFYAHDNTLIEVPLDALLLPGMYHARLSIEDEAQDARADRAGLEFVVDVPPRDAASEGLVPGLTEVLQGGHGQIPLLLWSMLVIAGLVLAAFLGWVVHARRLRGRRRGLG